MKKKKLLLLKSALNYQLSSLGLTWENVHHLGKNNIRLIAKLMRQIVKLKRAGSSIPRNLTKKFPQGTAEYKERKLLEVANTCAITHRKEVISELLKIARKLPNMPLLPIYEKELAFGEALYTFDYRQAVWVEGFYFNVYSSRHMHELHISLANLRLLQQQKKNKPFLALWKKQRPKGYDLKGLLALVLPTDTEILEKRIAEVTTCLKQPAFSEVKDNLATLLEQDKICLASLRSDE